MTNIDNKIIGIIADCNKVEIKDKGYGWVNIAPVGIKMQKLGIDIHNAGFGKLRNYFESLPTVYEICDVYTKSAMVVFVRLISRHIDAMNSENDSSNNNDQKLHLSMNAIMKKLPYIPLESWAYLRDINKMLDKLAQMAQEECWEFKNGLPAYPSHPILYNYLRYTFCRLQHQDKISFSINGDMAAFNTGLTDERYEPIIALFKKNRPGSISNWIFYDFVIAGEDKGKIINNIFADEIKAATYTDNPSDLIYDLSLGAPIVDMDHIIIERIERLPFLFLTNNAPVGFNIVDVSGFSKNERNHYYDKLREAVRCDSVAYRNMINRVKDALNLALKRIHWNYKNAVPMFYPKENKMCLLLPLCLVDDRHEDIALVVKRTPAKKYEGATILPLDWAYSDARVVTRPNSEWLDAKLIPGQGEVLI